MEQLEGRVAVITGGGSGIGEGLARACHDAGMRVVVSDIQQEQAERVADAVRELSGDALAVRTDVSDPASVEELAERAYDAYGEVNLLCSNAGVLMNASIVETPIEDWRWTLGVNVYGAVHCVRSFVPRMRAQTGEAHIVITASTAGTRPMQMPIGAYATSMYAAVGLAEMLRLELEPDGIGVSVLCPGAVDTQIANATRNRPPELGGSPPDADAGTADREPRATESHRMPALEAAERTLEGVRANRLYVFTHPETRGPVEERHRRMMADYDAVS